MKSIFELNKELKKRKLLGSAVEVGVAEGRMSELFMKWGFKKLYLVDAWQHLEQDGDASMPDSWHKKNLKMCHDKLDKYGDAVGYLQGLSKDVVSSVRASSLSFAYIDGDHSYEGVKMDISLWLPKLKKGGIMAFHDYNDNYGVKTALDEFVFDNKIELHVLPEEHIDNQGAWFVKG